VLDERFPGVTSSVPQARHRTTRLLTDSAGRTDVELVVSELATNAVRHARTPFRLRLVPLDGEVLVRVDDENPAGHFVPADPATAAASSYDVDGRGLALVAALARTWGVRHEEHGTCVWAVVSA
jgi:anti-sigma regulatory factor (Ser/Thr protein kinase)